MHCVLFILCICMINQTYSTNKIRQKTVKKSFCGKYYNYPQNDFYMYVQNANMMILLFINIFGDVRHVLRNNLGRCFWYDCKVTAARVTAYGFGYLPCYSRKTGCGAFGERGVDNIDVTLGKGGELRGKVSVKI